MVPTRMAKQKGGPHQAAQQLKKSSFNVHFFKIAGSKSMIFLLVRAPPLSTPEGLLTLLHLWKDFKSSSDYDDMLRVSRKKSFERVCEKAAVHSARLKWQRALRLSRLRTCEQVRLSVRDRALLHLLFEGTLARELNYAMYRFASGKMPGVAASVSKLAGFP